MASNSTATLSSLLKSTAIDDHEQVLKAAKAVLQTSKANQDALHTQVVALLKLDRFDDALRVLSDGGDKLAERCALEKAYALYKVGNLVEAGKVIEETKVDSRGLKHIAAQVAYRAERFEDASKIYKDLSTQGATIEGEENDLRINSAATDAQLEWQGNGDKVEESRKKPGREDMLAFETSYNAACGCIARGEFGTGNMLLKRARDLCEGLDDLTDEDKKAEVLPIMVQQAYVLARMGKMEEAEMLHKMINVAEVPEPPTRVIAQNNALASVTQSENPYLTQRLFDSVPTLGSTEQHFKHQASIMQRNRYTMELNCQKYRGVIASTAKMLSKDPSPNVSAVANGLSAINVAAYAQCGTSKASLKQILPLLEKRPTDVGLILTIIQLYILTSNPGSAIALLESFFKRLEQSTNSTDHDVRFAPGLVALMVSLYRLQGRKAPIKLELGKAASYWRRKSKPSESLLKEAGISLLDSSKAEDLSAASEIFTSLRKQEPSNRLAIAGFVASKSTTNFAAVEPDLEKLSSVEKLITGIDGAALEDGGIASLPIVMSEASKKRSAPAEVTKPAKKRVRKSQLPKDYEEGKKMDPERWLPLKDRSTYRPKGKKGKKKALEATQGGVVKEEETLEVVGGGGGVIKVEKTAGPAGKKKGKKPKR